MRGVIINKWTKKEIILNSNKYCKENKSVSCWRGSGGLACSRP